MKHPDDQKTRELPAVNKPGRKPMLGRPLTSAERQERRRLLMSVRIGDSLDQLEAAMRLIRHEVDRATPELELAMDTADERLETLREALKSVM